MSEKINPQSLKPAHLMRLLNTAGRGTVLTEHRLRRHRNRAGYAIGTEKTVNLFKYAAWLTHEYFREKQTPMDYVEKKRIQAIKNTEAVRAAQDIGELPAVIDPKRKAASIRSFKAFCENYFNEVFYLKWSEDHLRVIDKIERSVLHGGLFALAMPRGSGKALALDTPIPTVKDGYVFWKTMGTLEIDDLLLDENGEPSRVEFATEVSRTERSFAASSWLNPARKPNPVLMKFCGKPEATIPSTLLKLFEVMSKVYLTLGAIVKNEQHYVREWLAHYRAVGFEKFAIVLNECTDETEKQIRSLSFSDDIDISHTSAPFPQVGTYNRLCKEWKDKTFWMAFLDADEFLFCPDGTDVRSFLSDYERHSGLMVHNYEFGSSGHVIRPEGLAITSFLYRAKENHWMHDQFKCVIRLDKCQKYLGPHLANVDGEIVREDHRAVPPENIFYNHGLKNGEKPICRMIRYNHYHHRSMEDFVARSYRGDACRVPRGGKSTEPQETELKAITGPGDTMEPVVTIMLPEED